MEKFGNGGFSFFFIVSFTMFDTLALKTVSIIFKKSSVFKRFKNHWTTLLPHKVVSLLGPAAHQYHSVSRPYQDPEAR
jgi:hypothetical protein